MKSKKGQIQTHGKAPGAGSLYELLGKEPRSVFGNYPSKEDFEESLKKLNLLDLQEMCVKAGVLPGYDRHKVVKSLVQAYDRDVARQKQKQEKSDQSDEITKPSKAVSNILNQMR